MLEIAKTITVNKSLVVVMSIGPLLCINLVYTVQWYGANALTGHAWLLIIPLITLAFLLAYLHKYTWHAWEESGRKKLHFAIGPASTLLFLAMPFVFLANVNLMLFPGEGAKVKGFFSSLQVGNVSPRYLHFLFASVALTGLFGAAWFWRKSVSVEGFTRHELRRNFYGIAAVAAGCQFLAGPLLLFTLPSVGVTGKLYAIILPPASLGLLVTWLLMKKWRGSDRGLETGHAILRVLFSIVVLGMGSGRHSYREASLAPHQAAVKERSAAYEKALASFNATYDPAAVKQTPEQMFATPTRSSSVRRCGRSPASMRAIRKAS